MANLDCLRGSERTHGLPDRPHVTARQHGLPLDEPAGQWHDAARPDRRQGPALVDSRLASRITDWALRHP